MSTVIQIVREHLTSIGADGLVLPDAECGCTLDDFAPCGERIGDCQPGWISRKADNPQNWLMWTSKEKADAAFAPGAQDGEGK